MRGRRWGPSRRGLGGDGSGRSCARAARWSRPRRENRPRGCVWRRPASPRGGEGGGVEARGGSSGGPATPNRPPAAARVRGPAFEFQNSKEGTAAAASVGRPSAGLAAAALPSGCGRPPAGAHPRGGRPPRAGGGPHGRLEGGYLPATCLYGAHVWLGWRRRCDGRAKRAPSPRRHVLPVRAR